MNEFENSTLPEQEEYKPRPAWQVWAARVGVIVMVLLVIWQCVQMAWGLF